MLVLSHGQSSVKRDFSVNKGMLTRNLAKDSLVAYRTVYDGAKREIDRQYSETKCCIASEAKRKDVSQISVTKSMLILCRSARSKYQQYLHDAKKTEARRKMKGRQKLKNNYPIYEIKNKMKLESTVNILQKETVDKAVEVEKKMKLDLLSKSNAF